LLGIFSYQPDDDSTDADCLFSHDQGRVIRIGRTKLDLLAVPVEPLDGGLTFYQRHYRLTRLGIFSPLHDQQIVLVNTVPHHAVARHLQGEVLAPPEEDFRNIDAFWNLRGFEGTTGRDRS